MAMNKKEKALLEEFQVKAALHLSTGECPQPDIPVPTHGSYHDKPLTGFVACYNTVQYACSSSVGHATSHEPVYKTRSQRGIEMYSSKTEALKALRFKLELEFAEKLHRVDKQIAKSIEETE